jgi:hypothetical protein
VAAPSFVFTLSRVAEMLREDEELLRDLAMEMEPEDGCLTVLGTDDLSTIAFTRDGLEYLKQLVVEHKERG